MSENEKRYSESKCCRKCGELKALAAFGKHARGRHGLQSWCRQCKGIQRRGYYAASPERGRAYQAKWARANPEKSKANCVRWVRANPERARVRAKRYYEADRASRQARNRASRARYLDHRRATARKWKRDHPSGVSAINARRRARKVAAPGDGLTSTQWQQFLRDSLGICAYCNERRRLTLDHIEPINEGGAHDIKNIAAACGSCNASKRDTQLLLWLAARAISRKQAAA